MLGVQVGHPTIQRWVYWSAPLLEIQMNKRELRVENSRRMDETYIKIGGQRCYLY